MEIKNYDNLRKTKQYPSDGHNKHYHKIHYESVVLPEINRKVYFRPKFIIEEFKYNDKKDIISKSGGDSESTYEYKIKNSNEDEHELNIISEYDAKTINKFIKYMETLHGDIRLHNIIIRYILHNPEITWELLKKYYKYLSDTYKLEVRKCEECCLISDIIPFPLKISSKKILCAGDNTKYKYLFNNTQELVVNDAINIENRDDTNKYDLIILTNILHHSKPVVEFKKYKDMLSQNGKILIEDFDISNNHEKDLCDLLHLYQKYIFDTDLSTSYVNINDIKQIITDMELDIIDELQHDNKFYLLIEKKC